MPWTPFSELFLVNRHLQGRKSRSKKGPFDLKSLGYYLQISSKIVDFGGFREFSKPWGVRQMERRTRRSLNQGHMRPESVKLTSQSSRKSSPEPKKRNVGPESS